MAKKKRVPDEFESNLISLYLQNDSIEQVFNITNYDLPVSFATYHRILNRFGIVKSAGPNSRLSESLHILSLLNNYKVPLERVYRKYAPNTMKISTNTLHRILHYIRLGVTRRCGAALLISPESNKDKYLIAQDISISNALLGQEGDFSLPMGHTRMQDSHATSITRVLQKEAFTDMAIKGNFPFELIDKDTKPEFYINIADIKVGVFRLVIPDRYNVFSSFKLHNFHFLTHQEITENKLRPGVEDIIKEHEKLRYEPVGDKEIVIDSSLNLALIKLQNNQK